MERYVQQLQRRAEWRARRMGQFALGAALMATSVGFVTAALWAYLAAEFSPVLASLICGGVFFLAAGGIFLMAGAEKRPEVPSFDAALRSEFQGRHTGQGQPDTPPGARPPLIDAFLTGYEAWLRLNKKHD